MPSSEPTDALEWTVEDDLNHVVTQLRAGDGVFVNNRSLPLEVFERGLERIGSDPNPTYVVFLEGRAGRVYRLRGPLITEGVASPCAGCDPGGWGGTPVTLELRREAEWSPSRTVRRLALGGGQQIVSSVRAGEWLAAAGIELEGTGMVDGE